MPRDPRKRPPIDVRFEGGVHVAYCAGLRLQPSACRELAARLTYHVVPKELAELTVEERTTIATYLIAFADALDPPKKKKKR